MNFVISRRTNGWAEPAKTPQERCDELGMRMQELAEARAAQRLHHVREATRLEHPSAEEKALDLRLGVELQVAKHDAIIRDELAGQLARADQLDAEAAQLEAQLLEVDTARRELERARKESAELGATLDSIDEKIGTAVIGVKVGKLERLEAQRRQAASDAAARLEEVVALEDRAAELHRMAAQAAGLRTDAQSLRDHVRERESALPEHLDAQRIALAVRERSRRQRRLEAKLRRGAPDRPASAADVIDQRIAICTDAEQGKVSVEVPYELFSL